MQKYQWLNQISRDILNAGYLDNQTPEERIHQIAHKFEEYSGIKGIALKFIDYMERGFYSLSSPVWANYGNERGLPVSCFGSFVEDTMESILYGIAENGMLMKHGGGTSGYFGELRPRGAKINSNGNSSGSVHFMGLYDKLAEKVSQGSVRRGFFSGYLPIDHPDALEFLEIGTEGHEIQGMTNGVCVSDEFLERVKSRDKEAGKLWAKVIKSRREVGYPYIFFTDNVNGNKPDVYRDLKMTIWASNMCTEIFLPSSKDETFTCVLSSINLLLWDEIVETDAIEVMTIFLDTVVQEFIDKTEHLPFFERARNFALRHRALGMGVLGWHSYLQSNMIAFDSEEAFKLNDAIHAIMKERAYKQSEKLAEMWGEPEYLKGYGRRNATLLAIAPTKSSSAILGQVSQSIEPEFSNVQIKDLAKAKVTLKNPYLEELLESIDRNTKDVWSSIKEMDGSVQHLDFLTQEQKDVFKTFAEISPYVIIDQAADRQQYLDQGQSINLMQDPDMATKDINKLYLYAHERGIKSLYYSYSRSKAQEVSRKKSLESASCAACEA